jgi:two-component system, NarL family, response regulator LiaR
VEQMMNELTAKKCIKVLLVEDHELTRIGLIHSLQKSNLVEVIGEAEDGQEAILKTKKLRPDVVLMDLGLPVMDGIQATQVIKETFPEIKVVVLTSHKKQDEVLASLTVGASAYCLKDIRTERLIQALELVMDGVLWIDPAIAGILLNIVSHKSSSKPVIDTQTNEEEQIKGLSPRELEVLKYIAEGLSNKEIAETLNISIFTVKRHVGNIIEKLAVDGRTQAAIKALKIGLIMNKKQWLDT